MKKFNIGDRVRVKAVVEVRKEWERSYMRTGEWRKIKRRILREPIEATVTGETHRREGFTAYHGEDGCCFTPGKAIRVILVRTDARRREIDVFPDDLTVIGRAVVTI